MSGGMIDHMSEIQFKTIQNHKEYENNIKTTYGDAF